MYEDLSLYINGQFLKGDGRKEQDIVNPATDEVVGKLPHAPKADLDLALESAHKAFQSWKKSSPMERSRILRKVAELSRATAQAEVQAEIPEADRRLDNVLTATTTSLRLMLGNTVLLGTGAPPPKVPKLPIGLHTFTDAGTHFRAYVTTLDDPNLGGLARLEVITSLATTERRQSELDRRLLVIGLLALAAAGIGTWLAAKRRSGVPHRVPSPALHNGCLLCWG